MADAPSHRFHNEPADRSLDARTLSALDAIRRASGVRRWSETRATSQARWHGENDMNEQRPPATAARGRSFSLAAGGRLMTRESVGSGVTTRSIIVAEPTKLSLLCWRHGRIVQPPFITSVRQGYVEIVRYVDNIWRMKDLILSPGVYIVEVINLGEEDVHLEMIRSAAPSGEETPASQSRDDGYQSVGR